MIQSSRKDNGKEIPLFPPRWFPIFPLFLPRGNSLFPLSWFPLFPPKGVPLFSLFLGFLFYKGVHSKCTAIILKYLIKYSFYLDHQRSIVLPKLYFVKIQNLSFTTL